MLHTLPRDALINMWDALGQFDRHRLLSPAVRRYRRTSTWQGSLIKDAMEEQRFGDAGDALVRGESFPGQATQIGVAGPCE